MWKTWLGEDLIKVKDYQAQIVIADIGIENDPTTAQYSDSWPISCILVRTGVVVKQVQLLDSPEDKAPNMLGWDIEEVAEWINEYDGPRKGTLRIIKFK
jgi:hypothetical protein